MPNGPTFADAATTRTPPRGIQLPPGGPKPPAGPATPGTPPRGTAMPPPARPGDRTPYGGAPGTGTVAGMPTAAARSWTPGPGSGPGARPGSGPGQGPGPGPGHYTPTHGSPLGPPQGPSYGTYGTPPGPPRAPGAPDAPRRPDSGGRGRTLAVVAAIVVLLAAAVTVVVLRPWHKDDTTKVADASGSPGGSAGAGTPAASGSTTQPARPGDSGTTPDATRPAGPGIPTGSVSASPSASPSPSADPAAQAGALSELLNTSGASRQSVIDAVDNASNCVDLPGARTALSRAADSRNELLAKLDQLKFDALPDLQPALAHLRAAWQESASADDHYAAWAEAQNANGCGAGGSSRAAGDAASGRATAAKQAFVQAWNPIASRYALPPRTELVI